MPLLAEIDPEFLSWITEHLEILKLPQVESLVRFMAGERSLNVCTVNKMCIPVRDVWGEFFRQLKGRMALPRGGVNGAGKMQIHFEVPMVDKATAEIMFKDWPVKADETNPCWEAVTMQQAAQCLQFQHSQWSSIWGYANARPVKASASAEAAHCLVLAAPPLTVRLRTTGEGLTIL